jgi:hypothetical protein
MNKRRIVESEVIDGEPGRDTDKRQNNVPAEQVSEEYLEGDDWITPHVTRPDSTETEAEEYEIESGKGGEKESNKPEEEALVFNAEQNRTAQGRSRMADIIRPNGHWNKRLIFGALGAVLVFVMFGLGGSSKSQKKEDTKPQPAKTLKDSRERTDQLMQFSGAEEQTLGTPRARDNTIELPKEEAPEPIASTEPVPGGSRVKSVSPPAPAKPEAETKEENDRVDEEFALVLRAGERVERETRIAEKEAERQKGLQRPTAGPSSAMSSSNAKDIGILPRARIELTLSEPLRSGIATSVEARVVSDIRDAHGKVVIPAGSTAAIPFLASEVNGRVINNSSEAALFITPAGQQITLRGVVKGSDGFAGLTGKVKKVGGRSTASRIFTGIARAGTRTAADVAGDISSEAESEINRASYDYRFPQFERTNRIVEVSSGTRFTFIVSR